MRDILFRGKSIYNNEWLYGSLVNNIYGASTPVIVYNSCYEDDNSVTFNYEFIKNNTLGQYTGINDVKGKKIFEGDIIKSTNAYNYTDIYSIDYKSGDFCINQKGVNFSTRLSNLYNGEYEIEVIGNIYDNPDLFYE